MSICVWVAMIGVHVLQSPTLEALGGEKPARAFRMVLSIPPSRRLETVGGDAVQYSGVTGKSSAVVGWLPRKPLEVRG